MTENMQAKADNLISKQARNNTKEFYGVTTQVITVIITDYSTGATGATVEVDVRKTETKGLADPESVSDKARLQMKKEGPAWKVDNFTWL